MGTTYQILLSAAATAFAPGGSASALVDPYFFIDPSLDPTFTGGPPAYTFIFSADIGNFPPGSGPPSETPLPAALPLFTTGLGALGLLGWRRKRKQSGALMMTRDVQEQPQR